LFEVGHSAQFLRRGVETVNTAVLKFGLRKASLTWHQQAEGGIGEPKGAVRSDRDIVRRVEPLALEVRDDRLRGAASVGTTDASAPMFEFAPD
jgi:hypothetical protein